MVIRLTEEIVRLESTEDYSDAVRRAVQVLRSGGLVVYPTDTSYGLGCDPRLPGALGRLVKVKKRERKLGVPLLFGDMAQCEEYHDFSELERAIARLFWPGAITLIVRAREGVADYLRATTGTIAIRVPDHQIPRSIARDLGAPVVGTSANISGQSSPFDMDTALDQLGDAVDLYIDAGPSKATMNSTIVGVEEGGNIRVYREGLIPVMRLSEMLKGDADAVRLWTSRFSHGDL